MIKLKNIIKSRNVRDKRDFMISLSDDKQADVIMRLTLHPDIWTIF